MYQYCGKVWSTQDMERIRVLLAAEPGASRQRLSQRVCELFDWRAANGKLKQMSCRVAMLKMHRAGLIELPPARRGPPRVYRLRDEAAVASPPLWSGSVDELAKLELVPVVGAQLRRHWNELVARYHYLGYKMLPGAQLRYLIRDGERDLGAMGFGAAAWKVAPRDRFIGWTTEQRSRALHLIVGQSRFLILPWIRCKNLASKALALAAKRLPVDWVAHYGFAPVCLESFVDINRFQGTCYKAANWVEVGLTQGRGKLDRYNQFAVPVKGIWLMPLRADFRRCLTEAPA
jgi:hypothetical protein